MNKKIEEKQSIYTIFFFFFMPKQQEKFNHTIAPNYDSTPCRYLFHFSCSTFCSTFVSRTFALNTSFAVTSALAMTQARARSGWNISTWDHCRFSSLGLFSKTLLAGCFSSWMSPFIGYNSVIAHHLALEFSITSFLASGRVFIDHSTQYCCFYTCTTQCIIVSRLEILFKLELSFHSLKSISSSCIFHLSLFVCKKIKVIYTLSMCTADN